MIKVNIKDQALRDAAQEGIDAFFNLIVDETRKAIGGELTAENLTTMSSDQITLIGYATLRNEIMDGGFVQLIHNGYGPFFFHNPFDFAIKQWGAVDLCRMLRKAKKTYLKCKNQIEKELTDEEFMALYENMPQFENFDDEFISNEEDWTGIVATYVDEHLENFITIEK